MRALVLGRDARAVSRMRVNVAHATPGSLYWCLGETPFNTELQRAVVERGDGLVFRQVPIAPKDPRAMNQLKIWATRVLRNREVDVVEVYPTPKPPAGWRWVMAQARRCGVLVRET